MKKFLSAFVFLLALFSILECRTLIWALSPNNCFAVICLLLSIAIILLEKEIPKINILFIVLYLFSMALLLVFGEFKVLTFILCSILIFPLLIIIFSSESITKSYMKYFTEIMFLLSFVSLFFFVFGSVLHFINPTNVYFHTIVDWGQNDYFDYYHLYCEGQGVNALGYIGTRNISIFLEGPMLSYCICQALFFELFYNEKGTRRRVIIVFLLTVISSFSTTGILVAIGLMFLKFYNKIIDTNYIKYFIIPIVTICVILLMRYVLIDKFTSNIGSTSLRIDDIQAAWRCFLHNPVVGAGYNNQIALYPYRHIKRLIGLSTGSFSLLAFGGVFWGIWYILPLFVGINFRMKGKITREDLIFIIMNEVLLLVTVLNDAVLDMIMISIIWNTIIKKIDIYIRK